MIPIYNIQLLLGNLRYECRRKQRHFFPYEEVRHGKSNLEIGLRGSWFSSLNLVLQKLTVEKLCLTIICLSIFVRSLLQLCLFRMEIFLVQDNFIPTNDAIFSWIGYMPEEYWCRMHDLPSHCLFLWTLDTFCVFSCIFYNKNKQLKKAPNWESSWKTRWKLLKGELVHLPPQGLN